jgi:A/G-specific adenine glycosylase
MEISEFQQTVYSFYESSGRVFPWRLDTRPWGVLISEFMLQQTQTDRVVSYWKRWLDLWPDPAALAAAPMEEVLREWSGLGYNRRAKFLRECAVLITEKHGGLVPKTPELLRKLPGIGEYSSGAIACFAYNHPSVFIETNIRAVVIHFFFQEQEAVRDDKIFPILEKSLDRQNPREWYWALMDYGAALKKVTANPSRKSAHYMRQSRFDGSFRQMRGKVIKSLAFDGPASAETITGRTGIEKDFLYPVLESLEKEMMVAEKDGLYRIP